LARLWEQLSSIVFWVIISTNEPLNTKKNNNQLKNNLSHNMKIIGTNHLRALALEGAPGPSRRCDHTGKEKRGVGFFYK